MGDDNLKRASAQAAMHFVPEGSIIGVGSGSTVNFFIAALTHATHAHLQIKGAVAASNATAELLNKAGIAIYDLNSVRQLPVYIDGADEINENMEMMKGGGGSLTREKIVAAVAISFVCMADESKLVGQLGRFPLPIEVIPMASGYIARELEGRGGRPVLREGFVTDNGNVILDMHDLRISDAVAFEEEINQIPGVVTCGIFARRPADILLLALSSGNVEFRRIDRT